MFENNETRRNLFINAHPSARLPTSVVVGVGLQLDVEELKQALGAGIFVRKKGQKRSSVPTKDQIQTFIVNFGAYNYLSCDLL